MLIKEQPLSHWIDNFYGYGSWEAKFWFVGYEESGGELPEEVADKINYFYRIHSDQTPTLCDIRELYRHVGYYEDGLKAKRFSTRHEYRFDNHAIQNNTWKNLTAFAHGFQKQALPDTLEYQKTLFASSSRNEALIPLYPLPSPHNHAWYYSWIQLPNLEFIRNRAIYQTHLYSKRISTILQQLQHHSPRVVLMYGMANINDLKVSVKEFFPNATFKMVKAIPQLLPQHHLADLNGTKLLITTQLPTLRHNRIETGFDWEELGRRLRED